MSRTITLPENWQQVNTKPPVVPEGEYSVKVISVTEKRQMMINVTYKIEGDDKFANRRVYQGYDLETDAGLKSFKAFTEAINADDGTEVLDLDACEGASLVIKARHNIVNGKTYVNVVHHRRNQTR